MNDNIIWKNIIISGVITNYQVNNIGQVRNKITNNIFKSGLDKYGYSRVSLYINNKRYIKKVHRLVAQAFIPNPDNKPQVNHINGIKTDNRVENLEWCTCKENIHHAFSIGLKKGKEGSENVNTKYTDKQIHEVCRLLEHMIPMKLISEILNIKYETIKNIKNHKSWKHISSQYNINSNFQSYNFKHNYDEINNLCKLLIYKIPMKLISEILNIDYSVIVNIKNGYIWKSISSQYNINYKEKYKYKKIKYKDLKKILIELNMFNGIDLLELLESKYITHKNKLIDDLIKQGYEIFIDSKLYMELYK